MRRLLGRGWHWLAWLALLPGLAGAAPVDFELAGEQGFVRLSALPPRVTLINLWRYDCPPCLEELPLLAALAAEGEMRVVTVALHKPADTLRLPEGLRAALAAPVMRLDGASHPEGLLRRLGNPRGLLPFSVVVNGRGEVCGRLAGKLTQAWVRETAALCPP